MKNSMSNDGVNERVRCEIIGETYCKTHECGAYDTERCCKDNCPHCAGYVPGVGPKTCAQHPDREAAGVHYESEDATHLTAVGGCGECLNRYETFLIEVRRYEVYA